ncbi:MAG: DUF4198 domain-containing protein, partial [Burkholderiales bacterium]
GGAYALYQGHRQGAQSAEERLPYAPEFVKRAACADGRGATKSLERPAAYPARFAGDCAALLVLTSSGHWTKTAWETMNRPKAGLAPVLKSWRAEDTVKRLDRWNAAFAHPLSQDLEICPLQDPFGLRPEDKLRLRVTQAGRPRAGLPVAYDGATRGLTSDDGTIVLKIRHRGMQVIATSLETPLHDGEADTLLQATTLQFELPQQ